MNAAKLAYINIINGGSKVRRYNSQNKSENLQSNGA